MAKSGWNLKWVKAQHFFFTIPKRLDKMQEKRKLGQILADKNLVSMEEVYKALDEQKKRKESLIEK